MERIDSASPEFVITPGSSISSLSDKVSYNINAFPFLNQALQANIYVNSNVFYMNNLPFAISDLGPSFCAGMFPVSKQLSDNPPKRPRKQPERRVLSPELFMRMGLADSHEVAREIEQWVSNLLRQQGFKLG